MTSRGSFGVAATIIDAPVLREVRVRERALVVVDEAGAIASVTEVGSPTHAIAREDLIKRGALNRFGRGRYLLPGLIDLHNHAPQWPQLGKALDVPLEDWLEQYTFPDTRSPRLRDECRPWHRCVWWAKPIDPEFCRTCGRRITRP
jgi:guanine deaminase